MKFEALMIDANRTINGDILIGLGVPVLGFLGIAYIMAKILTF